MQAYNEKEFEKSIMAGLFAGIAAVIFSLIFNLAYRDYSGFTLSMIINVSSIIFGFTIALTIVGVVFYGFHHFLKNGTTFYRLLFSAVTVLLLIGCFAVQRNDNPVQSMQFRELLAGLTAICGACAVFGVPWLFNHDVI